MGSDTWLTLRTSIGGNYASAFQKNYTRWQYENSENNSAFGFGQSSQYSFAWVFTNTATYKKTFGKHAVEVMIGQEALNTGAGWNTTNLVRIHSLGILITSTCQILTQEIRRTVISS